MYFIDHPVLAIAPHFDGIEQGQLDDLTLKPVGMGAAAVWKPTTKMRRTLQLPFKFLTRADWIEFRDFVNARRGMSEGFWLPAWLTDLPTTAQAQGQPVVTMDRVGLSELFVAGGQFAFMAFIKPGDDYLHPLIEPHQISAVDDLGTSEQMTLATNIAADFPLSTAVVCALLYVRFDSDEIAYEFETDEIVRAKVDFTELPKEYLAGQTATAPLLLFEMARAGQTWRFTNYADPLLVDGDLWFPEAIDTDVRQATLECLPEGGDLSVVTNQKDHPLRYLLKDRRGLLPTTLSIFEVDADTLALDRTAPLYQGKLDAAAVEDGGRIKVSLSSPFMLTETTVPKAQIQRPCNLRLGDAYCAVNLATFTTAGTLTGLDAGDPPYVEAIEWGNKASAESDPNWFALGYVIVGSEKRLCVGQNGNRLYVDFAFAGAAIGQACSAVAGCDKRIQTCDSKFGNVINHLGLAYLPNTNPQQAPWMDKNAGGGKK